MKETDLSQMLDFESMMSPEGFLVYVDDGWKYAYKISQLKSGLASWRKMNITSGAVEAWIVKPVNDGSLHKRSALQFKLADYT